MGLPYKIFKRSEASHIEQLCRAKGEALRNRAQVLALRRHCGGCECKRGPLFLACNRKG